MKPLFDKIIIEQIEITKSSGGIYVPEGKEKPSIGKVLNIGKDVKEVKIGETVAYAKWKSNPLKHQGKEYQIVKEEDILVVL